MRTWLCTPILAVNRSISCSIKYSVTKIRTTIQKSKTKISLFIVCKVALWCHCSFHVCQVENQWFLKSLLILKTQIHESLTTFIHVINFKEASGRFFFHFLVVFEKCIEYIRIFFSHFRQISKFWYILIYFRRILWLLSWSLQGDQGGITCACCLECIILERTYYFIKKNINNRI